MKRVHSGVTGGEILLVCTYSDEMGEWVIPRSNSFEVSGPSPLARRGGSYPL
jgi:hypothetical protein